MNSIVVQSRTDAPGRDEAVRALRTLLGAAILTLLLVTLTPFRLEEEATASGNIVNQLGYTVLGVIAIAAHFLFTDRRVAFSLLRPAWLLMAGYLCFSITQSHAPADAQRAVLFTLVAMVTATAAVCLPPDARSFRLCLTVAALAVLALSYAGIVALPGLAIHHDAFEPQHAGLWRGVFSHKNIAGPVMAALLFGGLYLIRSGDRLAGWAIALLAAFFIYKTGSKTTLALVPVVALLIVVTRAVGGRILPVAILSAAVAGIGLLTLGTVLSPFLDGILQSVLPGTTFTGRADLWRFALDVMQHRQWTGFGFGSFWLTDVVFKAEAPFELSWDPRGIVNAHSGYLDIAIAMGWPALAVAVLVLVVLPFRDYVKCRPTVENERLADFFLMVLAFALMGSFLETYLFKRADPVWMCAWIAVVGLRLLAKFRIEQDSRFASAK